LPLSQRTLCVLRKAAQSTLEKQPAVVFRGRLLGLYRQYRIAKQKYSISILMPVAHAARFFEKKRGKKLY